MTTTYLLNRYAKERKKTVSHDHEKSGAQVFVDTLIDLGIEYLFLNPGFDLVPILGVISAYETTGIKAPRVIMLPHEAAAVAAAHGSALVSGKPQVVALFEDVGTLQGGGALVNLQYGRVPVILCSGKNASPLHRLDWTGEPFDQRNIVRNYVKWDHPITPGEDISTVIREAYRIASEGSRGPVYLTLERASLLSPNGETAVKAPVSVQLATGLPDLEAVADILINAKNPLILTAYAGRNPQTVPPLVELAEKVAIRVIPTDLWMSYPSTHPLCPGIDASAGHDFDHFIEEADVVVLIDYNFPGPGQKQARPQDHAKLIQIDLEPLKKEKYLWDRKPDLLITGDSSQILPQLIALIDQKLTDSSNYSQRFAQLKAENEAVKKQWQNRALQESDKSPISKEWLCSCLNDVMDDDTILVHMIPSNADGIAHQIRRTKPGTIFSWGDNAGSMGWPLGAAFGAKLAAPNQTVISLIGDGGFMYGEPIAALWGAKVNNAPFLTVIANNQSYASIKELMRMFHGQESVTGDLAYKTGVTFQSPPDYAKIAESCGAYGVTIEQPQELPNALRHALNLVRQGQSAVLNVIMSN